MLPPRDKIAAAFQVVNDAIRTEPTPKQHQLMVGLLLDGLFIKAGDDTDAYIQTLSWCLADAAPDACERSSGPKPPPWIPIPALAPAARELWLTYRGNFGRPPPIPDVLDLCTRYRKDLGMLRSDIVSVRRTRHRLAKIVRATEDASPDEDWGI